MSDAPEHKLAKTDRVSWVVGLTVAGLTVGGILAIFGAPLRALVGH